MCSALIDSVARWFYKIHAMIVYLKNSTGHIGARSSGDSTQYGLLLACIAAHAISIQVYHWIVILLTWSLQGVFDRYSLV